MKRTKKTMPAQLVVLDHGEVPGFDRIVPRKLGRNA